MRMVKFESRTSRNVFVAGLAMLAGSLLAFAFRGLPLDIDLFSVGMTSLFFLSLALMAGGLNLPFAVVMTFVVSSVAFGIGFAAWLFHLLVKGDHPLIVVAVSAVVIAGILVAIMESES